MTEFVITLEHECIVGYAFNRRSERGVSILGVLQEKAWIYLTDLANIGSCIPGCESVSIVDSNSAVFRIKLKSAISRRRSKSKRGSRMSFLRTESRFFGDGSDAEVTGNLELKEEGAGVSVKYRIEIRPVSVTGGTAIPMIGKDLVKKQATEFASCVKAKLEKSA